MRKQVNPFKGHPILNPEKVQISSVLTYKRSSLNFVKFTTLFLPSHYPPTSPARLEFSNSLSISFSISYIILYVIFPNNRQKTKLWKNERFLCNSLVPNYQISFPQFVFVFAIFDALIVSWLTARLLQTFDCMITLL